MTDGKPSSQPACDESGLDSLVLACLEVPDGEREAAIENACRECPQFANRLRARLALLSKFGFVADGRDARTAGAAVPDRIDSYRVIARIGQGAMGVVYEAVHEQLGRRVALKCLRAELVDSERARERFRRETQAAAQLDHSGLCTLYETGEWQGAPYLAMQLVAGQSLEQHLRDARHRGLSGWRTPELALRLVAALCDAVAVVHDAGFVHRDLKPANVMVRPEGDPVVLDFGLARDLEADDNGLTLSTDSVGTPAYMAPEQVDGQRHAIDARTDVHALGAILYECLTLRPPFVGRDRNDTYRRILVDDPVDVRRLQPAATRATAIVVAKALGKAPADRYSSASELGDDLRRIVDGSPIHARPAGLWRRLCSSARRRPVAATAGAGLLVAIAVGTIVGSIMLVDIRAADRDNAAQVAALRARRATTWDSGEGAVLGAAGLDDWQDHETRSSVYAALAALRLEHQWTTLNAVAAVDSVVDGSVWATCTWTAETPSWLEIFHRGRENATPVRIRGRPRRVRIDSAQNRVFVAGHLLLAKLCTLDGEPLRSMTCIPRREAELVRQRPIAERAAFGIVAGDLYDDGRCLTVSRGGYVRLWNAVSTEPNALLLSFRAEVHDADLRAGAYDPRTRRIVTADAAGGLACWNAEDGSFVWHEEGAHVRAIGTVEFSSDGVLVLSSPTHRTWWSDIDGASAPGAIGAAQLRLAATGSVAAELRGHNDWITSASFALDGTAVLTTGCDRQAIIWDLEREESRVRASARTLPHGGEVDWGVFAPHGRLVLTGARDGTAALWRRDGVHVTDLRGLGSEVFCGAFTSDSQQVLTGSRKRLLRFDCHSAWARELDPARGLSAAVFAPDGDDVITCSRDGVVQWWPADGGAALERQLHFGTQVTNIAWDATRQRHVVGLLDGRVAWVDLRSGDVAAGISVGSSEIRPCLLKDGEVLTVEGNDAVHIDLHGSFTRVSVRDLADREGNRPDGGHIGSTAWDPSRDRFALGNNWQYVAILNARTNAVVAVSERLGNAVTGLAYSRDGLHLFAATADGQIFRCDPETCDATRLNELWTNRSALSHLTVDPRGRFFVTGDPRGQVTVWSFAGEPLLSLPRLAGSVRAAVISADGERLLTTSRAGDVRVWPLYLDATGARILEQSPYQDALHDASDRLKTSAGTKDR